jgi:hypothetical protein
MKASDVAVAFKGTRAIKRVPLPLAHDGYALQAPTEGDPQGVAVSSSEAPPIPMVGLRALTSLEMLGAVEATVAETKRRGGQPQPGDPIYDLELMHQVLTLGCIDPDDPKHGPFFDGGTEQIRSSELLCGDGVALLYQLWAMHHDAVQQPLGELNEQVLDEIIEKGAGQEGAAFFLRLAPALQLSSWLFMANMLSNSRTLKSPSGADSKDDSKKRPPPSPKDSDA